MLFDIFRTLYLYFSSKSEYPHIEHFICCHLDLGLEIIHIIGIGFDILAESVNNNSMISSVGQEVGVDVTFDQSDFVNTNWETN